MPVWTLPPSLVAPPQPTPQPTPRPTAAHGPTFKAKPLTIETLQGRAAPLAPAIDGGTQAANAINDFGFDLLRHLDQSGNLCFSPTSIEIALAMARAGAKGQTATEMDAVMRSFGADDQAAGIVALLAALKADNAYEKGLDDNGHAVTTLRARLDLANASFAQRDLSIEQAYLDALSSRFSSPQYLLDVSSDPEKARQAINTWVYNHTQGRIPEILAPGDVNDDTILALVNAIYLQAKWAYEFEPESTKARPFTRLDGSKVSVPTMNEEVWWMDYASGPGWRAVDLPYYGHTMSMTIVVPDDMASFVARLDAAELREIQAAEKGYDVTLYLPRFEADTHVELKDVLEAMGMPTAFGNDADLSGITADPKRRPHIEKVIHQANVNVDEEGTTASAATVVLVGAATAGGGDTPTPPPKVTFYVDHPFLFFIHDNATGAVLFAGRVLDPSVTI